MGMCLEYDMYPFSVEVPLNGVFEWAFLKNGYVRCDLCGKQ